jgi:hypothetical protein
MVAARMKIGRRAHAWLDVWSWCEKSARCRSLLAAAVLALGSAWLRPSLAAAHGIAPRALAPLLHDADGLLRLVQLSRGLAWRSADGFHYFCPSHFDGSESLPVAALPGGSAALALPSGLFLIGLDGSTTPYPEADLGSVLALASSDDASYALLLRGDRYELRRLALEESQLLWSGAQTDGVFTALGASDDTLVLFGVDAGVLSQLTLDSGGKELSRGKADVGADTLSVEAHVAGATPYAIVQSESGDRIELGRIAGDHWLSLAQAVGNLSGPVVAPDGKLFIAVDGALASFDDEKVAIESDTEFVTAVAVADGKLYASVRDGLRELSAHTLGDMVFSFETLRAPIITTLSPTERTACDGAWQHLQVDLVAAGLLGVDTPLDGGVATPGDAASARDARAPAAVDASVHVADAGSTPAHTTSVSSPASGHGSHGCSAHPSAGLPRANGERASTTFVASALATLALLLRRRRHVS